MNIPKVRVAEMSDEEFASYQKSLLELQELLPADDSASLSLQMQAFALFRVDDRRSRRLREAAVSVWNLGNRDMEESVCQDNVRDSRNLVSK